VTGIETGRCGREAESKAPTSQASDSREYFQWRSILQNHSEKAFALNEVDFWSLSRVTCEGWGTHRYIEEFAQQTCQILSSSAPEQFGPKE
jgi:hypothetical protein